MTDEEILLLNITDKDSFVDNYKEGKFENFTEREVGGFLLFGQTANFNFEHTSGRLYNITCYHPEYNSKEIIVTKLEKGNSNGL